MQGDWGWRDGGEGHALERQGGGGKTGARLLVTVWEGGTIGRVLACTRTEEGGGKESRKGTGVEGRLRPTPAGHDNFVHLGTLAAAEESHHHLTTGIGAVP